MTDWRALRSAVTSWWSSNSAQEVRAAWHDTRRAPGMIVAGMIAVFWPLSGWSWLPVAAAAVAFLIVRVLTRPLRWRTRTRVRRAALPLVGLVALVVLTAQAGLWAWLLAIGLWLVVASVTDTWRARRRLEAWVISAVARTARVDPEELEVERAEWDEQNARRLVFAEIKFGQAVRAEEQAARERIAQAVSWALRHAGQYSVTWPPGMPAFEIKASPALPSKLYEQDWEGLPGIPIGATDLETADGVVDMVDSASGEVIQSIPVALVNPANSQKHYLVVGGTGAGKSVWTRGFIARALRLGWFPGGVYIFDGKGSSDYIVFEGREGVHCVARHPEEWAEWLPRVSATMRQRYEDDAEYHRGNRSKPTFPRYLVVLEEVQEIRATLGKAEFDPIAQQISRQMRASEGRLMVSTQRPDAEDAIPTAVKDMLEERIILGFVSATGARMVLDQDWRAVVDEYGSETVPGRGMARTGGRLRRIQGFNLDTPRTHPEVERYYPRRLSAVGAPQAPEAGGQLPANVARWAPRPAAPAAAGEPVKGDQVDPNAPTPPHGIPRIGLAAEPPPEAEEPAAEAPKASGDHSGPSAPRRRRRTV